MKTWIVIVTLAWAVALVPSAAADGPGENAEDCDGIVDISCDYDDNRCFLYVEHNSPDISRCIIGG
jgi:hypothetical protein